MGTKLFSYNVEDDDGRLVISVEGAFAKVAIAQLHEEINSGNGWKFLSSLSPISSLNRLSRIHVPSLEDENNVDRETLDVIFNQGFADDFKGFEHRIDEYGETLRVLEKLENDATATATDTPVSSTTTEKTITEKSPKSPVK